MQISFSSATFPLRKPVSFGNITQPSAAPSIDTVHFGATEKTDPLAKKKELVKNILNAAKPLGVESNGYQRLENLMKTWLEGLKYADEDPSDEYARTDERLLRSVEGRWGKALADDLRAKYPDGIYRVSPGGDDITVGWLSERLHDLGDAMPNEVFDAVLAAGLQRIIDDAFSRRMPNILDYNFREQQDQSLLRRLYYLHDEDVKPEWAVHRGGPGVLAAMASFLSSGNRKREANAIEALYNPVNGSKYLPAMKLLMANKTSISRHLMERADQNIWDACNLTRLANLGEGAGVLQALEKAFNSIEDPQVGEKYVYVRGAQVSDDPAKQYQLASGQYFGGLLSALRLLARRDFPGLGDFLNRKKPIIQRELEKQTHRIAADPFYQKHPDLMSRRQMGEQLLKAKYLDDVVPDFMANFDQYDAVLHDLDGGKRGTYQNWLSTRLDLARFQALRGVPGATERQRIAQRDVDAYVEKSLDALLTGDQEEVDKFYQVNDHYLDFVLENASAAILPKLERVLSSQWHPDAIPEPWSHFPPFRQPGFSHLYHLPEIDNSDEPTIRARVQFLRDVLKAANNGEIPLYRSHRR